MKSEMPSTLRVAFRNRSMISSALASLIVRLEHDVKPRRVDRGIHRSRADRGGHARHVRILPHDFGNGVHALHHGLERNILRGIGHADNHARVLLRQQSFWDDDVKQNRRDQRDEGDHEDETLMREHPAQAAFVPVAEPRRNIPPFAE